MGSLGVSYSKGSWPLSAFISNLDEKCADFHCLRTNRTLTYSSQFTYLLSHPTPAGWVMFLMVTNTPFLTQGCGASVSALLRPGCCRQGCYCFRLTLRLTHKR